MRECPGAKQIVLKLKEAGFVAYYAGGWVRDFLLQLPSDDVDIATSAPPETVQALFPRTVPIGIAFGIVLVVMEERSYEVATFRQDFDYQDGRRPSRIAFSTEIEDAQRRDFTINGMFYDPLLGKVLDYVGGQEDLKKKTIRAIGDPHQRIQEDRLRMIRAVRLSCRFQFEIEQGTEKAIRDHAKELFPSVAIERVWQELSKAHDFGSLYPTLLKLYELHLLQEIFPKTREISLQEIKHRLKVTLQYPIQTPLILFLLPLLVKGDLEERLELCRFFKLSNADQELVLFLTHAEALFNLQSDLKLSEWAHFYAHPNMDLCLRVYAARLHSDERKIFQSKHDQRRQMLSKAIERIQKKSPLIRSEDLKKEGIEPGPLMGILLKEAEEIAINQQIEDPKSVMKLLKKSIVWPFKD